MQQGRSRMQQGAARCSRVQQGGSGCSQVGPGCSRGCGWMSPNSGRAPRCSMGTAGRSKCAAGCSRVRPGCTGAAGCSQAQQGRSRRRRRRAARRIWAQQGRSRRLRMGAPGVQQVRSRRNGCNRERCLKSREELRQAGPPGRTRGAAGALLEPRVPQAVVSPQLRRSVQTDKKRDPFRIRRKLFSV